MSTFDSESERRFVVLAHAAALLGLVLPLGQILGPYLVYLLAPRGAERVRRQASDAFGFQMVMVVFVLALTAILLWLRAGWWFFVLFVPNLYALGTALWAATKASRGGAPRYPFAIHLLRPAPAPASRADA